MINDTSSSANYPATNSVLLAGCPDNHVWHEHSRAHVPCRSPADRTIRTNTETYSWVLLFNTFRSYWDCSAVYCPWSQEKYLLPRQSWLYSSSPTCKWFNHFSTLGLTSPERVWSSQDSQFEDEALGLLLFQLILKSVQSLWVYVPHSLTSTRVIAVVKHWDTCVDVQIRCLSSRTSYPSVPYPPDQPRQHPRSPTRRGHSSRTDPDHLNDSLHVLNICIAPLTAVTWSHVPKHLRLSQQSVPGVEMSDSLSTRTRCIVKIWPALTRHRLAEGANSLISTTADEDCTHTVQQDQPQLFSKSAFCFYFSSFDSGTRPNQNEIFLD